MSFGDSRYGTRETHQKNNIRLAIKSLFKRMTPFETAYSNHPHLTRSCRIYHDGVLPLDLWISSNSRCVSNVVQIFNFRA